MKFSKAFLVILFLAVIAFICSCKKDSQSSSLGFLQVGHQWTYQESYQTQSDTMTLKITSDSSNIYTVVSNGLLGTQNMYWFVNGNYLEYYVKDSLGVKSQPSIIYEINSQVGNNWRSVPPGVTDTIYSRVAALNVADTTPVGIYSATAVNVSDSIIYASGPILKEYWSNSEGVVSIQGLYTLKLLSKNF